MCHCLFDGGKIFSSVLLIGLFFIYQTFGHTRPLTEHEILHLKEATENNNSTEGGPLIKLFGHNRKERCFFPSFDQPTHYAARPDMPWKIDPRIQVITTPSRPIRNSVSAWENAAIPPLGFAKYV